MAPDREESIEKIRRDHDYMLQLIDRIRAECNQRGVLNNCNDCHSSRRLVCHGNITQLIRSFVEATLKHNFLEAMFIEHYVPAEERSAHIQAHLEIAQQLKDIRVVFSEDGNSVLAIEGIERVYATLQTHFEEYDAQLEAYLLPAA